MGSRLVYYVPTGAEPGVCRRCVCGGGGGSVPKYSTASVSGGVCGGDGGSVPPLSTASAIARNCTIRASTATAPLLACSICILVSCRTTASSTFSANCLVSGYVASLLDIVVSMRHARQVTIHRLVCPRSVHLTACLCRQWFVPTRAYESLFHSVINAPQLVHLKLLQLPL